MFDLLAHTVIYGTRNGWGHILGDFFQTHLVTLQRMKRRTKMDSDEFVRSEVDRPRVSNKKKWPNISSGLSSDQGDQIRRIFALRVIGCYGQPLKIK
jgi:hypothetical protein